MKKQIILTVTAIFAVMFVLSGCSLGKKGRANNLSSITATPIQQVQPQNNEMNQKMDAMIRGQQMQTETLEALTSAIINNNNSKPVIANNNALFKKPEAGVFSKKKKTKGPTAKKTEPAKFVSLAKFQQLERKVKELSKTAVVHAVALREKSGKYEIFRIHNFARGDSSLKHDDMEKQVNKLILLVEEENLKYLKVIGYTNADGDKNNLTLSGERAKAVLEHITMYRPGDIKDIEPEEGGETRDFGIAEENRCVIVVCEKKQIAP